VELRRRKTFRTAAISPMAGKIRHAKIELTKAL
jgi:hypothetical protein